MKPVARLAVIPRDDLFVLHVEDDGGSRAEYALTAEQLDALIEAADDLLEADDTDELRADQ